MLVELLQTTYNYRIIQIFNIKILFYKFSAPAFHNPIPSFFLQRLQNDSVYYYTHYAFTVHYYYIMIVILINIINNSWLINLYTGVFDQPRVTQFGGAKGPASTGVRVADLQQHGRRVRQAETVERSSGGGRLMAQTQSLVSNTIIII